jgi:hypothetical protein
LLRINGRRYRRWRRKRWRDCQQQAAQDGPGHFHDLIISDGLHKRQTFIALLYVNFCRLIADRNKNGRRDHCRMSLARVVPGVPCRVHELFPSYVSSSNFIFSLNPANFACLLWRRALMRFTGKI